MIPIPTSLILWNQNKQCPGIIQCPRMIQCPGYNVVKNSDSIPRNPLDPIPSTSWYNSSFSVPSASSPRNSVYSHSRSVPRINKENTSVNKMSASAKCSSPPPKKRRSRKGRVERRARERENRNSSFIHDARWVNQRAAVPGIPVVPERVAQSLPEAVDPHISHADGSVPAFPDCR